tara:strand:- start:380 stop:550 length:171 start_codon:yes stop_codon:yes gene_type:complete
MKEYYVKEYAVITYRVKAKSRAEVKQMIEDCNELVSNPMNNVGWDEIKHTIKEIKQ